MYYSVEISGRIYLYIQKKYKKIWLLMRMGRRRRVFGIVFILLIAIYLSGCSYF